MLGRLSSVEIQASPRAPSAVVYHFTNSLTVIPGTLFRRAPSPGARYRPFEPAEDPYRTAARAQIQSTTQFLLGTGGGPRPKKDRSAPAQAIVAGEDVYLVDCGDGVARPMVSAALPPSPPR